MYNVNSGGGQPHNITKDDMGAQINGRGIKEGILWLVFRDSEHVCCANGESIMSEDPEGTAERLSVGGLGYAWERRNRRVPVSRP